MHLQHPPFISDHLCGFTNTRKPKKNNHNSKIMCLIIWHKKHIFAETWLCISSYSKSTLIILQKYSICMQSDSKSWKGSNLFVYPLYDLVYTHCCWVMDLTVAGAAVHIFFSLLPPRPWAVWSTHSIISVLIWPFVNMLATPSLISCATQSQIWMSDGVLQCIIISSQRTKTVRMVLTAQTLALIWFGFW